MGARGVSSDAVAACETLPDDFSFERRPDGGMVHGVAIVPPPPPPAWALLYTSGHNSAATYHTSVLQRRRCAASCPLRLTDETDAIETAEADEDVAFLRRCASGSRPPWGFRCGHPGCRGTREGSRGTRGRATLGLRSGDSGTLHLRHAAGFGGDGFCRGAASPQGGIPGAGGPHRRSRSRHARAPRGGGGVRQRRAPLHRARMGPAAERGDTAQVQGRRDRDAGDQRGEARGGYRGPQGAQRRSWRTTGGTWASMGTRGAGPWT